MFNFYIGETNSTPLLKSLVSEVHRQLSPYSVGQGDIVICRGHSQIAVVAQWLAAQDMGFTPFFASPDFTIESSDFIKYADPKYSLDINGKHETIVKPIEVATGPHIGPKAGSVIHMTSATSGRPKFILRDKAQLDLEIQRYCKTLDLTKSDVILSIPPFYHAYAFLCPMLGALETGASLVQPDIVMPRNIIQLTNKMNVSCLFGIPYFLSKMLETMEDCKFNSNMRYIISSGEKLTKELAGKFKTRFGISLRQQYGSTETGTLTFSGEDDVYESQGKAIEGNEISLVEKDGKQFVAVNTNGTMGHYIGEKLLPISEGLYITNDLGFIDKEGRLFIEGRGDDVVIKGGRKINLKEVERIIQMMPHIQSAKVESGTDDLRELICFYNSDRDVNKMEIINFCRNHLSEYQIPKIYRRKLSFVGQSENWKHKNSR